MLNLEILHRRHSVRNYGAENLSAPSVNKLRAETTFINSHEAGLNFQLCLDDGDPFKGFSRSYGMFSGVRNYLAAVIDPTFPDTWERAGYFGEQFVMAAVEAGLGTCFVSGTYSRANVNVRLEVYEKIAFLVTFGHETGNGTFLSRALSGMLHMKRKTPRDFFEGSDTDYKEAKRLIPDLDKGLEAIACAPSAANRQPVRIHLVELEGVRHVAAFTSKDSPDMRIDLGIAKFNFASVVNGIWEWGQNAPFIPS